MMERFMMNRIAVEQFAILSKNLPAENISLSTELSFQYSVETSQIGCTASFMFNHEGELLLLLSVVCEFVIHPDDWAEFNEKGGEFAIPKSLLELLAVHTIGTSRGILFCKTEGTPFSELMIPPLNGREMIDEQEKE